MIAPDDNPSRSFEIETFSRFIGVDWSLTMKTELTIKSTEDKKSQDRIIILGKH